MCSYKSALNIAWGVLIPKIIPCLSVSQSQLSILCFTATVKVTRARRHSLKLSKVRPYSHTVNVELTKKHFL